MADIQRTVREETQPWQGRDRDIRIRIRIRIFISPPIRLTAHEGNTVENTVSLAFKRNILEISTSGFWTDIQRQRERFFLNLGYSLYDLFNLQQVKKHKHYNIYYAPKYIHEWKQYHFKETAV
jgi:hypothetical protein